MISTCQEKILTGNGFARLWKIKMPIWQTEWKTWWWEKMLMTALTILIFISSLLLKFSWETWVLQGTHPISCSLETSWWAEQGRISPLSLVCKSYSKIDFRDFPGGPVAKTPHFQFWSLVRARSHMPQLKILHAAMKLKDHTCCN